MLIVDEARDLRCPHAGDKTVAGTALHFQRGRLGARHQRNLGRRFAAAQGVDQRPRIRDPFRRQGARQCVIDEQRHLILKPDARAGLQPRRDQRVGTLFLLPGKNVPGQTDRTGDLGALEARADIFKIAFGMHDRAGEPLRGRPDKPGEVAQAPRRAEQHGRQPRRVHRRAKRRQALRPLGKADRGRGISHACLRAVVARTI